MRKGTNVVIKDLKGRILLLKRHSGAKYFPIHWNLPGGEVEEGETLKDAAVREVKEETGLDIQIIGIPFFVYYYPDGVKDSAISAIYSMNSNLIGGELKLDDKHTDFKWVSKRELKSLKLTLSALATLKKIFKLSP